VSFALVVGARDAEALETAVPRRQADDRGCNRFERRGYPYCNRSGNRLRGAAGNDTLAVGAGIDIADYSMAGSGVVEVSKGSAANDDQGGADTVVNDENVIVCDFNDILVVTEGANRLDGANGNDTLTGNPALASTDLLVI